MTHNTELHTPISVHTARHDECGGERSINSKRRSYTGTQRLQQSTQQHFIKRIPFIKMPGPCCDKCKDSCKGGCKCGDNCKCCDAGCGDKCGCESGGKCNCKSGCCK